MKKVIIKILNRIICMLEGHNCVIPNIYSNCKPVFGDKCVRCGKIMVELN